MASDKQVTINKIYALLGTTPPKVSRGSTEPKQVFTDIVASIGLPIDVTLSKPKLGEAIAHAAGLPWDRHCDSTHTRSGGGSTVTAVGLERLLQSFLLLLGAPTPITTSAFRIGAPYRVCSGAGPSVGVQRRVIDLDAIERLTHEHMKLQDAVAAYVRTRGRKPMEPEAGDPQFDLAWTRDENLIVCEVKTLQCETRQQLRLGMGQVAEYRHVLHSRGAPSVLAVLATDRRADPLAHGVAKSLGITLAAAESLAEDLAALT